MRAESEADWTTWVIGTARWHGWLAAHFRPARTTRGWRTPVQGDAGFPDVVLAKDGVVVFAELKTQRGRVAPEQRAWLAALGARAVVWRPADRDAVLALMREPQPDGMTAPGYDRIADAIRVACEVADIHVAVLDGDGGTLGLRWLATVLDKAGLIDWAAFDANREADRG